MSKQSSCHSRGFIVISKLFEMGYNVWSSTRIYILILTLANMLLGRCECICVWKGMWCLFLVHEVHELIYCLTFFSGWKQSVLRAISRCNLSHTDSSKVYNSLIFTHSHKVITTSGVLKRCDASHIWIFVQYNTEIADTICNYNFVLFCFWLRVSTMMLMLNIWVVHNMFTKTKSEAYPHKICQPVLLLCPSNILLSWFLLMLSVLIIDIENLFFSINIFFFYQ